MAQEIFKVQQSQATSDGAKRVLVYNKELSCIGQFEADASSLLGGRPKAYFYGTYDERTGLVDIGDEVEEQDW